MDDKYLLRTSQMYNTKALSRANILFIGLDGSSFYTLESLVRSGVEHITIIDKAAGPLVARLLDINPLCKIKICEDNFYNITPAQLDIKKYNYIIDLRDDCTTKNDAIREAFRNIPIPLITKDTIKNTFPTNNSATRDAFNGFFIASIIINRLGKDNE